MYTVVLLQHNVLVKQIREEKKKKKEKEHAFAGGKKMN